MPDEFITAEIETLDLERKFSSLADDMKTRIINSALRDGARVMQEALTAAAPVRLSPYTKNSTSLPAGALKSDVIISKIPNVSEYDVKFGKQTSHVARFVDQGHRLIRGGYSHVNKRTGKTSGEGKEIGAVPPHEFADEAFEGAAEQAEKTIEASLTAAINKASSS